MSQPAGRPPTRPQSGAAGGAGTNPLTRKLGFQPAWAWAAEGIALAAGFWWWRSRQQAKAAASKQQAPAASAQREVFAPQSGLTHAEFESLYAQGRDLEGMQAQDLSLDQHVRDHDRGGQDHDRGGAGGTQLLAVPRSMTFEQLAQQKNWTPATVKRIEGLNIERDQRELTPQTRLRAGEKLLIPVERGEQGGPTEPTGRPTEPLTPPREPLEPVGVHRPSEPLTPPRRPVRPVSQPNPGGRRRPT